MLNLLQSKRMQRTSNLVFSCCFLIVFVGDKQTAVVDKYRLIIHHISAWLPPFLSCPLYKLANTR